MRAEISIASKEDIKISIVIQDPDGPVLKESKAIKVQRDDPIDNSNIL